MIALGALNGSARRRERLNETFQLITLMNLRRSFFYMPKRRWLESNINRTWTHNSIKIAATVISVERGQPPKPKTLESTHSQYHAISLTQPSNLTGPIPNTTFAQIMFDPGKPLLPLLQALPLSPRSPKEEPQSFEGEHIQLHGPRGKCPHCAE